MDSPNVAMAAKARGASPDFSAITRAIAGARSWSGYACVTRPTDGRRIDGILEALVLTGFETLVWEPANSNGAPKTNNDVQVVAAALRLAYDPRVDAICLVGADSDMRVIAIEARRLGKAFFVARYAWQRAAVLDSYADRVVVLGEEHLFRRAF